MNVLLIDNYDSFTYNVVHLLRECGVARVTVRRNTKLGDLSPAEFDAVVGSPGPGLPETSGALLAWVRECVASRRPYLGVCLGHQALGQACGAELACLPQVRHGVRDECRVVAEDNPLFAGLPSTIAVGRYHSWVVREPLPDTLRALSFSNNDDIVQAMQVRDAPIFGVQFHPESVMSADVGRAIVTNFLAAATPAPHA